jgi:hypothetical protein
MKAVTRGTIGRLASLGGFRTSLEILQHREFPGYIVCFHDILQTPQNDNPTPMKVNYGSSSESKFPEQAVHRNPLSSTLIEVFLHHPFQGTEPLTIMLRERHYTFYQMIRLNYFPNIYREMG